MSFVTTPRESIFCEWARDMFWTKLKRVIKGGVLHFTRNGVVSLATVLVMTVTLFAIGSVIFLLAGLDATLEEIKNKVDINVYFTTQAPEEDMLALKRSLEAFPEVKLVEYVSRTDVLARFRERHENDQLTLQALEELGENPFGAVLNIRAKEPSQYEGIAEFLKSDYTITPDRPVIIDEVNYYNNKAAIDRLSGLIVSAKRLGVGVTVLLVVISIIIALNTIRLTIYISRDEISVMRLVGASMMYVRGPFVVSGVLYGVVASLLTLIVFYPTTLWFGGATEHFFSGVNLFRYYLDYFGQIFLIIVGSGITLGAVSSWLAVRRYLTI